MWFFDITGIIRFQKKKFIYFLKNIFRKVYHISDSDLSEYNRCVLVYKIIYNSRRSFYLGLCCQLIKHGAEGQ